MNFDLARANMIEQQVRPWDVLDQNVLDAMARLPRERFVDDGLAGLSYADADIPLANGGLMTLPKVAARMAQTLQIQPTDKVLEIGTGSGYVTALLAELGSHVYSVDNDADQLERARANLAALNIGNTTLVAGDGLNGLADHAPYNAIAVTGSLASLDDRYLGQLAYGGRLFVVTGNAPVMEAKLYTHLGTSPRVQSLFETDLPRLVGAEARPSFQL